MFADLRFAMLQVYPPAADFAGSIKYQIVARGCVVGHVECFNDGGDDDVTVGGGFTRDDVRNAIGAGWLRRAKLVDVVKTASVYDLGASARSIEAAAHEADTPEAWGMAADAWTAYADACGEALWRNTEREARDLASRARERARGAMQPGDDDGEALDPADPLGLSRPIDVETVEAVLGRPLLVPRTDKVDPDFDAECAEKWRGIDPDRPFDDLPSEEKHAIRQMFS